MTLELELPSSKSMTQRALVLAALARAPSTLHRPLDCDDSRHLRGLLEALGTTFRSRDDDATIDVTPAVLPLRTPHRPIACGNAGTAIRFGSALSLLADGPFVLDGDDHMRRRPIGPLVDALRSLGIDVEFLGTRDCPPIRLERSKAAPAHVTIDTSVSSQFASALLLVAPLLPQGLRVELTGSMVSRPYVAMTVTMLRTAGVHVEWHEPHLLHVFPGTIAGISTAIEVDWSAAAFIVAAARITGADLSAKGLVPASESIQGDAAIVDILDNFDRTEGNVVSLRDCPDLLAPVVVAALFATRPTRIRDAAHARVKECDRLSVLAREFGKIGARFTSHHDGLDVVPLGVPTELAARAPVWLDPCNDHRMAMAFGVASLRLPSIGVLDPGCVSKSFPKFWESLALIRAHVATSGRVTALTRP